MTHTPAGTRPPRRRPPGRVGAPRRPWWAAALAAGLLLVACQAGPQASSADPQRGGGSPQAVGAEPRAGGVQRQGRTERGEPPASTPSGPVRAVCGNVVPGPATAPAGAVVIDPAVDLALADQTAAQPPGTTFWLAPGTHTLGRDQYGQVAPKDGNTYLGAPGAVLDGRGLNGYAFVFQAADVTIRHLTVRGFVPPVDQGVVNHDSGPGWVIEHNTIEENRGAGLMGGDRQQVRGNCLRNNGQYGMNAFGGDDLVVEGNEIVGNNTDDLETRIPGCGCTGGVKFWDVDRADVRGNWVHDNRGVGLWADTNNNDFLVEGNVIEDNDGEAMFYETSYNLIFRNNMLRRNALVSGREFAADADNFPVAAIYLSEAGGEPAVPARTDRIEVYGNILEDNWSGITAWENSDRFCNSPGNTSTGYCTLLVDSPQTCSAPAIASPPLYDRCRWKTQRVDIHDNEFRYSPAVVGCSGGLAGRMAVLANFGTYPEWSPYMGDVVQEAITFGQQNLWHDNTYVGPWTFVAVETGTGLTAVQWQSAPYGQDRGSTFSNGSAGPAPC